MRDRLSILGIVAFVVVDAVLIFLAVRHTSETPPPSNLPEAIQSAPSEEPEKQRSRKQDEPRTPPADTVYTSLARDGAFIRATRGNCDDGAASTVEVSTNRGGSFITAGIPNLTEVLRVQASAADNVWLVGTNSDCELGFYSTTDAGRTWQLSDGFGAAWYLMPNHTASRIHAPNRGVVDTPCTPIGLSTIDTGVLRVLCGDGPIIGTEDGGRSWVQLGRLDEAVAIRFTSAGDGYAVADVEGCQGAVMRTEDGGANWEQLACPGEGQGRSIAGESGVIAAQIGDDLLVSNDGGSNWQVQ